MFWKHSLCQAVRIAKFLARFAHHAERKSGCYFISNISRTEQPVSSRNYYGRRDGFMKPGRWLLLAMQAEVGEIETDQAGLSTSTGERRLTHKARADFDGNH